MKKLGVRILKWSGFVVLLLALALFVAYRYFSKTFVDFESEYVERTSFDEIEAQGYLFKDRNGNGVLDPYEDDRQDIKSRVKDALSQMTLEEKIHLLKGSGMASAIGSDQSETAIPGAVGTIVATPRLGLPTVYLSDGPAGLRILPEREGEEGTFYCTAFPIATLLASSWNEKLLYEVGQAMGNEAKEYGIDVILGPGANIHRHPFCGRNFEYFSEDPLLTGYMGSAIVNGIESEGVGTSVKHFVANNQETERTLNNVEVSDRALREIYLRGFEYIVRKSQPWTIMSSYNKVNGEYTSESGFLLEHVLRDDWGFEGLVMTDWYGGRNAPAQISAGNDLLEPGTKKQWKALEAAAEEGSLPLADIDRAAGRILELVFKTRKMKGHAYANTPDLKKHARITRKSASEGMVLLKNDGALPFDDSVNEVALLGIASYDFIAGGTGSGDVNEAYSISLRQGLEAAGYAINKEAADLFVAHKAAHAEQFVKPEGMEAMFQPFDPPKMEYDQATLAQIAQKADIGILTIGRNSGEGGDRVKEADFLLTDLELKNIEMASKVFGEAGKELVVVLNIGGVVETASWKNWPNAILLAWQGGQEGGNSVVDLLNGSENPSGRLPMTFPIRVEDHASHANFPLGGEHYTMLQLLSGLVMQPEERPDSEKMPNRDYTVYKEDIYVGYRHFDKNDVEVSFPFGYGLSYTQFLYEDVWLQNQGDTISLGLVVKNIGSVAGKDVVQVYSGKSESKIDRPKKELRGFTKTAMIAPGQQDSVHIAIPKSHLEYWDSANKKWQLEPGTYSLLIGPSSRDIKSVVEVDF